MSEEELEDFIRQWDLEILDILFKIDEEILDALELKVKERQTICEPGCDADEICKLESKFDLKFPPEYIKFLLFSDGLAQLAFVGGTGRFLSAREVNRYKCM